MHYLVCSDNFVGFLSAVYDSYYNKNEANEKISITKSRDICSLLDTQNEVLDDLEKAKKVRGGIIKKGGKSAYDLVQNAYRSCNAAKESIILDYLRLFFKEGTGVLSMYHDPAVAAFNDLTRKVYGEVHRLIGFIRLQEMSNGAYYGYYSSDNDVLELVMPDFVKRFNTQRFVLHDYKRQKMAFFDGNTVNYALAPKSVEIELSEREAFFQQIWKQYHQTVTIKERQNKNLQSAFLPQKYRHFMNEF